MTVNGVKATCRVNKFKHVHINVQLEIYSQISWAEQRDAVTHIWFQSGMQMRR